jgi:alkylation response protein AidB-like acyl-CoA dehydrogenase
MLLLARTTPLEEVEKKTEGLSTFIVDMKAAVADGKMTIRPIKTMMNHASTEIFLDGVSVPEDALVGEEGKGFRYILDGMNAERILIAAETIGDRRWFQEGDGVRLGSRLRPPDRAEPGVSSRRARACAASKLQT